MMSDFKLSDVFLGKNDFSFSNLCGAFIDWLKDWLFNGIGELLTYVSGSSADIFSLGWISAFVSLFQKIGFAMFMSGLALLISDTAIAYEEGSANIKQASINVLKGFFAVNLFAVLPQRFYSFSVNMQSFFTKELMGFTSNSFEPYSGNGIENIMEVFSRLSGVTFFIFIILLVYCILKVVLTNIMRGGILLTQIAFGSLHILGMVRGMSDGFISWSKQVIALSVCTFLQSTILFMGLITFANDSPILGTGVCLAATEIPKIGQQFGIDTGFKINTVAVSSAINTVMRIKK